MPTEYDLAQPILEYFAKTYGRKVQVIDHSLPPKKAWLAYALDFSSTEDNPFCSDRIPNHERSWIRRAVMCDAQASSANQHGYIWFWFIDPKDSPRDMTDDLPVTYI